MIFIKKKTLKILSLFCVATMLVCSLLSCQSATSNATETTSNVHTVKFNSNGGTEIKDVEVRHGQKIAEPTAPTRENYIFLYWENNHRKWHFTVKEVTEDVTLSALWISATDLFKIEPCENENEILISGFLAQKSISILRIPEKINGKTVVGFTDNALDSIHELHARHLIVPKTVRSVGVESFTNISEVHIEFEGALSSLGVSSFEQCINVNLIRLAEGLTSIPYRCFFNCEKLLTSDIPEGVTLIEENAYASCKAMQTVVLPSTLEKIEDSAFIDCSELAVLFFKGTEEQFDAIEINNNNDALISAAVYFYSEEEPSEEGKFWHYDKNNTPILW